MTVEQQIAKLTSKGFGIHVSLTALLMGPERHSLESSNRAKSYLRQLKTLKRQIENLEK